jgi:hypothetical protein
MRSFRRFAYRYDSSSWLLSATANIRFSITRQAAMGSTPVGRGLLDALVSKRWLCAHGSHVRYVCTGDASR